MTGIRLLEGPTSSSVVVKWPRPPGAAAFVAQYKLEGLPGTPAEWLPADGFSTKKLGGKPEPHRRPQWRSHSLNQHKYTYA